MDRGFAPGYQEVIDACDALHFSMPAVRREFPDDAALMRVWRPAAEAILHRAVELDADYDDAVVFLFVIDRCDEMLESIGLPRLGRHGYGVAGPPSRRPFATALRCA